MCVRRDEWRIACHAFGSLYLRHRNAFCIISFVMCCNLSWSYPRQRDLLVQSILGVDGALPACVGEERTSWKENGEKGVRNMRISCTRIYQCVTFLYLLCIYAEKSLFISLFVQLPPLNFLPHLSQPVPHAPLCSYTDLLARSSPASTTSRVI